MSNQSELVPAQADKRKRFSSLFSVVCLLVSSLAIVVLVTLLVSIFAKGGAFINLDFLTGKHLEEKPLESGIGQAIIGTAVLSLICATVAIPIGIGTAIFLEEFQPRNRWLRYFHGLVQLNINNLAGVPSIVYGILGVTAFVYMFGAVQSIKVGESASMEIGIEYKYQSDTLTGDVFKFAPADTSQSRYTINEPIDVTLDGQSVSLNVLKKSDDRPTDPNVLARSVWAGKVASRFPVKKPWYFRLPFGKSVLAAGLTLALVILPIVIIASQEALRAVPDSLREAGFGMGATRWQVVRSVVLPSATPGIMTGAILSMSRAVGEAAPVLAVMGGVLEYNMSNLMDKTPVLPVTIFKWAGHSNAGYENSSAAAIIVLLGLLLMMNSVAILIRHRFEKRNAA
jgi:phosphate transport system permease protein